MLRLTSWVGYSNGNFPLIWCDIPIYVAAYLEKKNMKMWTKFDLYKCFVFMYFEFLYAFQSLKLI